jgi:MutS domain V
VISAVFVLFLPIKFIRQLAMKTFYRQKIDLYEDATRLIKKKLNLTAIGRMVLFLASVTFFYYYFTSFFTVYLVFGLFFLLLFLVLLRISLTLRDKLLLTQKLLFINQNELGILEGQVNQFNDGKAFQTGERWQDDLDIFGHFSLFHFLNRTTTWPGSNRLAALLSGPPPSARAIRLSQEAVKILVTQRDPSQTITAHGLLAEKDPAGVDNISDWLRSANRLIHLSWLKLARWLLPIGALASLYFWISSGNYIPLIIAVLANWILIRHFRVYISEEDELIGNKQPMLHQYVSILKTFLSVDSGSSSLLLDLNHISTTANKEIRKLAQLASFFDQRMNMLVNLLLNSLLAYDIQCILALEKWKESNKNKCSQWLSCIGEIESLNSLAVFAFSHPDACYPVINEDQLILEAKALAHPLIPEKERIANDFRIGKDDHIHLVTGSNMSGKTTFLRTIAVNLLLAQAGSPVIATYFYFSPLQILSSLRTQDSLHEHSSYFLAELKKLQRIILSLEEGKKSIVLIDEILKGTNSEDKTNGSEEFIRKLLKYNCLGLFATHDLALSKMEGEFSGQISNYCFESQIINGELLFDYTLKKGVAKNKNATFLMEKMGIIESTSQA